MPFKSGKSIKDVNNKINTLASERIPRRIRSALYGVSTSLGNYADFYVPIDTKNLVNSRKHSVSKNGSLYKATVGYYVSYAAALHSPTPGGKMDGWKPQTPEDRAYKTQSASNFTGKGTGGFNINATQGWLNIAWDWKGDEIMTNFAEDIIK